VPESVSKSRRICFQALARFKPQRGPYVTRVLEDACAAAEPTPHERAFAYELAVGVVKRLLTLNHLIESYSGVSLRRIDSNVQTVLRMGLYQILFMASVPERAAVDESVKLARAVASRKAGGFANAVLRNVCRSIVERTEAPVVMETLLSGRALPGQGQTILFDRDVFASDSVDHLLASALSHPAWLLRRWIERWGAEKVVSICFADNAAAPLHVRVNTLRTSPEGFVAALREAGVKVEETGLAVCLKVAHQGAVEALPGFAEGWFTVQDRSAIEVGLMLGAQAAETVLDACAAPGTKTTHMAETAGGEAEITAADIMPRRLQMITENVERLGSQGIHVVQADARSADGVFSTTFDRVLADVPCSNTGVLRRRAEARWRIKPEMITELAGLQAEILASCARVVKPGGVLVYSTCSIEEEENELVVRRFLEDEEGRFELVEERLRLPGEDDCDGGYAAKVKRIS